MTNVEIFSYRMFNEDTASTRTTVLDVSPGWNKSQLAETDDVRIQDWLSSSGSPGARLMYHIKFGGWKEAGGVKSWKITRE